MWSDGHRPLEYGHVWLENTVLAGSAEVSTALAEGVDISAASRIFGHHERTIARWLERSGKHAQRLHAHFFVHLVCEHLQLDELVTKVRGVSERVWIWVALEAQTKIVPVIHVGQRKHEDAQQFVHEISQRLAAGCLPVFTSDGLNHYFYALTAHFGHWVVQTGHRLPVWQVASGCCTANCTRSRSATA